MREIKFRVYDKINKCYVNENSNFDELYKTHRKELKKAIGKAR